MLCGAPSCSKACLFFSNELLCLQLQSVQYDLQHDFAWVTDEADPSVVPALPQVAFLRKCDDKGLGPQGWRCSCLPDLLQIFVIAVITSSPPAWTSSAGMLSTPADFLFFDDSIAASTSFLRMGWLSSVSVWGQLSADGSQLVLLLYSSEQYSVHRFSISQFYVWHFPKQSWTAVAFPCFTVVKTFTSWYALLLLFSLRVSSISLHCFPIHFSFAFSCMRLMLFTSLYF